MCGGRGAWVVLSRRGGGDREGAGRASVAAGAATTAGRAVRCGRSGGLGRLQCVRAGQALGLIAKAPLAELVHHHGVTGGVPRQRHVLLEGGERHPRVLQRGDDLTEAVVETHRIRRGDVALVLDVGLRLGEERAARLEVRKLHDEQAVDEWPTMRWAIGTNLGFSKYWGPGAEDSLDGVNGGVVTTSLDKATLLTNYHASFSGSVLPASVSEVFDSGVTNANTKTSTYSGQGSLTHQLNELNALGFSVSGSTQSFTNDGSRNSTSDNVLSPNTYLTAGPSWIRNVNPRTDLTLAATTGWYNAEGIGTSDSVSESVTLGIQTQVSERLNFTVGGGGNVVRTTLNGDNTSATDTGFVANVGLGYNLANTTFAVFAAHNLAPSSLGSLQERTTAGFSMAHQIGEWSSAFFSGAFVDQLPITSLVADPNLDQQHQALVLSVGYRRSLSQNWNLGLTYSFTQQDNSDDEFVTILNDGFSLNDGSSTSNAVFLSLTRNFNLFGASDSGDLHGAEATRHRGFRTRRSQS